MALGKNDMRVQTVGHGYYELDNRPPFPYKPPGSTRSSSWWNVAAWSKRTKIILGLVAGIVLIILVTVIPAIEVRKNRYPNYSKLSYTLADTYSGTSFFDNFNYFTGPDPTSGFVHYVPSEQAISLNLTYADSTSATLRVDTSVTNKSVPDASTGRFSVRISSKTQYNTGLFVFDVLHSPTGCGTWPALWLVDQNHWPENGEIDVMEAVNPQGDVKNQMALHTSPGCSMDVMRKQSGRSHSTSCVNSTDNNAGCGVQDTDTSFGAGFNDDGGGVMVLELRDAGIRMWTYARGSVPGDLLTDENASPDPSTWVKPQADFPNTDCDIGNHFKNQSIIVNINLCGSWAGDVDIYGKSCPGTCTDFVANNATAFEDAYWEFGAFKVFQAR